MTNEDGNAAYLAKIEEFKRQDDKEALERNFDMLDDDEHMIPVREAWRHRGDLYKARLNESMKKEQAKTFSDVLTHARENPDVLEGIKSLTNTKKGGKTRVFRKKSAKKVSRRNRRSRNIRRNRRSRAHKRK